MQLCTRPSMCTHVCARFEPHAPAVFASLAQLAYSHTHAQECAFDCSKQHSALDWTTVTDGQVPVSSGRLRAP
jgi:hypothetical protein